MRDDLGQAAIVAIVNDQRPIWPDTAHAQTFLARRRYGAAQPSLREW
jgi:hypothetical protein